MALLLLGLEVEAGGAVVDLPEPGNRTGPEQELLGERGFAGRGMAGKNDVAQVGQVNAFRRHSIRRSSSIRRLDRGQAKGSQAAMLWPKSGSGEGPSRAF